MSGLLRHGLLAAALALVPGLVAAQDAAAPPGPKLPDMPSLRQKGSDDPTKPAGALPPPAKPPAPKTEEKKPEPKKAEPAKKGESKKEAGKKGAKTTTAKPAKGARKGAGKREAKHVPPPHAVGKHPAAKPHGKKRR